MNHDRALFAPSAPEAPQARTAGTTPTACTPATRNGSAGFTMRSRPSAPVRMAAASLALGAALALAAGASLAPAPAHAQAGAAADASAMTSGEVRRIDREAAKLTIRHGEIPHLEMPPMTMVFRVRDAALLEGLKEGDRIRFRAEKDGRQYVVIALTPE